MLLRKGLNMLEFLFFFKNIKKKSKKIKIEISSYFMHVIMNKTPLNREGTSVIHLFVSLS